MPNDAISIPDSRRIRTVARRTSPVHRDFRPCGKFRHKNPHAQIPRINNAFHLVGKKSSGLVGKGQSERRNIHSLRHPQQNRHIEMSSLDRSLAQRDNGRLRECRRQDARFCLVQIIGKKRSVGHRGILRRDACRVSRAVREPDFVEQAVENHSAVRLRSDGKCGGTGCGGRRDNSRAPILSVDIHSDIHPGIHERQMHPVGFDTGNFIAAEITSQVISRRSRIEDWAGIQFNLPDARALKNPRRARYGFSRLEPTRGGELSRVFRIVGRAVRDDNRL